MKKFLLLILVVLLLVAFWQIPRQIKIKDVSCQSQYGPCSVSVQEEIASLKGVSLREVKKKTKAIEDNSVIEQMNYRFLLPGRLEIYVIEEKPAVAMIREGETTYFLYDKKGKELGTATNTQLPKVLIKNSELAEENRAFVSELLVELFRSKGVKLARIEDRSLIIELDGVPKLIFPVEGDIDFLLGSTELTLSWLNTSGENSKIDGVGNNPQEVDFRFKNPVLRY